MKKYFLCASILLSFTVAVTVHAENKSKEAAANVEQLADRLVSGIQKLDTGIAWVRSAYILDNERTTFKIQWCPIVTLKLGISFEQEKEIAKKVANFIINFQGGIPTDGFGGGFAIFEGAGWHPEVGEVIYKIDESNRSNIEVWADFNYADKDKKVKCCAEGDLIGHIKGKRFVAIPGAK